MICDQTDAGTPVLSLDAREYEDFLDEAVRSRVGMSAAEFRTRYAAGDLDDTDPDVEMLAGLLWLGAATTPAPPAA